MPSYINGVDASLIVGLGQIGVTPTTPTIYPSGGLVVNSGLLDPSLVIASGITIPTGSSYFYNRPQRMDSASFGTSNWTKIVGNSTGLFLLSSSGELYAIGTSTNYTGTGKTNTLAKVTTGSNWTDIAAGSNFAIGICDNKLFAIGFNSNGQFGDGTTNNSFTSFKIVNNNTWWTKVSAGSSHAAAISGSGGSGSLFLAGNNVSGRTGQNTATGNTLTFTQPVNFVGRIFTDVSCGDDYTLAISASNIYGTGENGDYTLGDGTTTDRNTFGLVSSASTFTRVFAFTDFSKAIGTTGSHFHAGNESNTRGDNSNTAVTTWTRLNTSGEFATGWEAFYAYHLSAVTPGTIGIKNSRPFYIGNITAIADWMPNTTWTDYTSPSAAVNTWAAFVSGSPNVSCSAAGWTTGINTSITDPILMLNLTPSS